MLSRPLFALIFGLGVLSDARVADVPEHAHHAQHADPASPASPADTIEIVVKDGYHPDRIVVKEGQPVRLVFVRKEYSGCTLEVVFPTLNLRRELPPGERVTIDLGTQAAGQIPFHCGMKMIHGVVVVEPKE